MLETVDCAKNALDKRTGGTVNGGITLGQNLTISWGGRTATYHENGDITGPAWGGALSGWIIARANEAQSNAWQHADHVANGRATWDYVNQNCVFNVQLGARQVNPGFSGRFDTPSGCVITSAHGDSDNWIAAQYAPIQIWKNNQWVTIAG
ncbi:hypothetical protein ACWWJF_28035 [Symbiopectobacterium sp. Eva_TO]